MFDIVDVTVRTISLPWCRAARQSQICNKEHYAVKQKKYCYICCEIEVIKK